MSWHKMTLKVIDVLALLGHRCLGTYHLSPNMLLYWSMIEYACDNGYSLFDFGRSSPDEGTYKFKKQWGAESETLHWHYISLNSHVLGEKTSEKSGFARAIQYWKRLPVSLTKIVGPYIRKYIGL